MPSRFLLGALALFASKVLAENFTIYNGQIFTPGFAIVDAPQPNTPEGGDYLQVALDVSADGKLSLPPYADDDPSQIFNITIFLYSYTIGKNFTISNGTATANNASLGDIMSSEPSSTVKHVNWRWPDCLVGDGGASGDRGLYNISIRQNFRLNNTDHYTIFDLPISVTNSIPKDDTRASCDSLENNLLTPAEIDAAAANEVGVFLAPNGSTQIEQSPSSTSSEGLSGSKPEATAGDGLGSGAGSFGWSVTAAWVSFIGLLFVL